jgi:RNA recognition motif-containing protein
MQPSTSSPPPTPPLADKIDHSKSNPPLSTGIQQKPKNLENAMWVGNLPTDTTPEELRDFFYDDDFLVSSLDLGKG